MAIPQSVIDNAARNEIMNELYLLDERDKVPLGIAAKRRLTKMGVLR